MGTQLAMAAAVAAEPLSADTRMVWADALADDGHHHLAALQRLIAGALAKGRHDAPGGARVKAIRKAFAYRKRRVALVLTDRVERSGDWWDGGSRTTYHTYDLQRGTSRTLPGANPFTAGSERRYEPTLNGVAVVTTEVFCGKPGTMTVYVHPDDYPLLVEGDE
jgi:hypothetical protein